MSATDEIKMALDDVKAIVERKKRIERLMKNSDFRDIFIEGYFKEEAIRLVGLSADPEMRNSWPDIQEEIRAVSLTQGWLRRQQQFGEIAEREIEHYEAELIAAESEHPDEEG